MFDMPTDYFAAARTGDFSVVLIPEYPNTWKKGSAIKPETVVEKLHNTLESWISNPRHIMLDLGEELKIYPPDPEWDWYPEYYAGLRKYD